ncbi:indole-3-glycerol phosphate synthase TrpC [soil metagenome]
MPGSPRSTPPTGPHDSSGHPGILERIVLTKREEVAALAPVAAELRARAATAPAPRPFAAALADPSRVSLIAEVQRRSHGAGDIDPALDPPTLAARYESGGAAAISVLTDGPWFGGSLADLVAVRARIALPCLRKDFTLDPLQLHEARAHGADAVLLIVRILSDAALRELREEAESLGLAVLVEAHDAEEVERALASGARILGVNNRDLSSFSTSLDVTFGLLDRIPDGVTLVSESGIRTAADVASLAAAGVDAILVGEALVRSGDATEAARDLSRHRPAGRGRGA